MIDGIPLSISDLSGWGVVAILAVMLLTGRGLATQREVRAEKERADSWQAAWSVSQQSNREKDEQIAELLEHSRTTVKVLEGLSRASEGKT